MITHQWQMDLFQLRRGRDKKASLLLQADADISQQIQGMVKLFVVYKHQSKAVSTHTPPLTQTNWTTSIFRLHLTELLAVCCMCEQTDVEHILIRLCRDHSSEVDM